MGRGGRALGEGLGHPGARAVGTDGPWFFREVDEAARLGAPGDRHFVAQAGGEPGVGVAVAGRLVADRGGHAGFGAAAPAAFESAGGGDGDRVEVGHRRRAHGGPQVGLGAEAALRAGFALDGVGGGDVTGQGAVRAGTVVAPAVGGSTHQHLGDDVSGARHLDVPFQDAGADEFVVPGGEGVR